MEAGGMSVLRFALLVVLTSLAFKHLAGALASRTIQTQVMMKRLKQAESDENSDAHWAAHRFVEFIWAAFLFYAGYLVWPS